MLSKIADFLPTYTRRSEEMQSYQQFSIPIPFGLAAVAAAALQPGDRVLEPSAGTGLLAILAEISGASLTLNELVETCAGLLRQLFPGVAVTSFDAAQIDDQLAPNIRPTVVLMNPPFSMLANVQGRRSDATSRHIASALARMGYYLINVLRPLFVLNPPYIVPLGSLAMVVGSVLLAAAITSLAASTLVNRLRATELLRDE